MHMCRGTWFGLAPKDRTEGWHWSAHDRCVTRGTRPVDEI